MFDQVNGLPVHILVLHAAVVFVPLLGLGAVVYALVAPWRPRLGWAVALLAVVAPASTFVAKQSGSELYHRLLSHGLQGKGKQILDSHMDYGTTTLWFSLALGVVSLVLVALTSRGKSLPTIAQVAFAVVTVALAAGSGYYIFKTGDSGATAVWGTY
ncbi:DUF2231 domain-containing protein [Actinoplanes teichomyceticus]|uniref:DUF2231 domain-containing protein n=1 Tax=Actinoplanes teichomyceticus TaxID=1867 RepID=A0A561WPV1_ACTTI|nr:DUF2231 domain-containing protein [Actinoplanes teichomyceticus]TWG25889.1 hypothetical protein FHX34_101863 [Actinoplanes teichomyceticus]GIF10964.1 hypothetical protein Ate01nite_09960 [Actinoplanes teichomyceticus]